MINDMKELRTDLVHAIAGQARREEDVLNLDANGFESYGRIKARLEKALEAVKPLEKTLKKYWEYVAGADEDLQASYLRELDTETMDALTAMSALAATINRAMWSMHPYSERKIGQMSMDELLNGLPDEDRPDEYDFEDLDETAYVDEETGDWRPQATSSEQPSDSEALSESEIIDPEEDLPEAGEVLGADE